MKPRIAFVSIHSPHDISTWSGLNYFILKTLEQHFECVVLSGFGFKHTLSLKIQFRLAKWLGKRFFYELHPQVCKQLGATISPLIPTDCEAIFTVNSNIVPFLKTQKPIFIYKDSTFANLVNFYGFTSNLPWWNRWQAHAMEQKAFHKAASLFFASAWAANSAISKYNVHPQKAVCIPFGANMHNVPDTATCKKMIAARQNTELRLLFVGKDFVRKGGPLAQQVLFEIRKHNLHCQLHFYSDVPEHYRIKDKDIFYHDMLDKSKASEERELFEAYAQSHFLILPTTAECFGVVFSEAAAFGVPSITFITGGPTSAVKEGENGWCLPLTATAVDFAQHLMDAMPAYNYFAQKARQR